LIDANWFYNLSPVTCYSYWTDIEWIWNVPSI